METSAQLEAVLTAQLQRRELLRAPGGLAFVHRGEAVKVTIDQSVYTGWFVTVHDRGQAIQRFRARAGAYDWNAIAALIKQVAAARQSLQTAPVAGAHAGVRQQNEQLASDLAKLTASGTNSAMKIAPSGSPGQVRVQLPEMDLDPVSVLQLFAVVRHALPAARKKQLETQALPAL